MEREVALVSLSPPHCYNQSHAEKRRDGERQVTLVSLSPSHCYNQSHAEKRREGETGDFGVALSFTLLQSEPCREEERGTDR